jgi:hypothetical protein
LFCLSSFGRQLFSISPFVTFRFFIIGGKFRGQLDHSADALHEYVSIAANLSFLHSEVTNARPVTGALTRSQVHPLRINVMLWDFGADLQPNQLGVPFPDAVLAPPVAPPAPPPEIIGVWERRDEYLGAVRRGQRLGVGPEPDNRHVDSRLTIEDFKVCSRC